MKVYDVRIDKVTAFVYQIKAEDAEQAQAAAEILAGVEEEELLKELDSGWETRTPEELPGETDGIDAAEVWRLHEKCDGVYDGTEEGERLFEIATDS